VHTGPIKGAGIDIHNPSEIYGRRRLLSTARTIAAGVRCPPAAPACASAAMLRTPSQTHRPTFKVRIELLRVRCCRGWQLHPMHTGATSPGVAASRKGATRGQFRISARTLSPLCAAKSEPRSSQRCCNCRSCCTGRSVRAHPTH
jgi:hypothetical protein